MSQRRCSCIAIAPDGSVPNHPGDPQKEPGNILIGQVWPDEVRILLKEVLVVHDLLYIEAGVPQTIISGAYSNGIIAVFSNRLVDKHDPIESILGIFEHEIAHAHQHAVYSVDGSILASQWPDSPEGIAYAEARRKDVEVLGEKMSYDVTPPFASDILENAAEYCADYWGIKRGRMPGYQRRSQDGKTLEELTPNRFKWAEEWLTKK